MITPILTVPHSVLRRTSTNVVWDKKAQELATHLADTLFAKVDPKGVGLSAPQIGKNKRMYVTWLAPKPEDEPTPNDLVVFINPVITGHSPEFTLGPDPDEPILEGCLSIPTLYGPVPRWKWVEMRYETIDHRLETIEEKEQRFSDFSARVIQHEQDHLDGILFTDHSLKHDLPVYEFIGKKMHKIDKEIVKGF